MSISLLDCDYFDISKCGNLENLSLNEVKKIDVQGLKKLKELKRLSLFHGSDN